MYITNSGVAIVSLVGLSVTISGIIDQYGDLPVYIQDDSPGVEDEMVVGGITVKSTSIPSSGEIKPLRVHIR